MIWIKNFKSRAWVITTLLLFTIVFTPMIDSAQGEEVASAFRRYKGYEASTGYYEQYEVRPYMKRGMIETSRNMRLPFNNNATAGVRSRMTDSHLGINFYLNRRCEECHAEKARNFHTNRANLTCRQCHGGEPIAGINHYYSMMNPIRRHAYVCAKCHEGASASFASYVVHEPNSFNLGTMKTFPALFYAFWIMIAIAGVTFVVFLPHTILWGIRELFVKKEKSDHEPYNKE